MSRKFVVSRFRGYGLTRSMSRLFVELFFIRLVTKAWMFVGSASPIAVFLRRFVGGCLSDVSLDQATLILAYRVLLHRGICLVRLGFGAGFLCCCSCVLVASLSFVCIALPVLEGSEVEEK